MIVRDFNDIPHIKRNDGVEMTDFFDGSSGEGVKMGYAVFPPGTVVPPASHTANEYSYILSGTVKSKIGETVNVLSKGMAGFIPAGEVHSSFNDSDEDCTLIWMLVENI